jgi:hypothetical protein
MNNIKHSLRTVNTKHIVYMKSLIKIFIELYTYITINYFAKTDTVKVLIFAAFIWIVFEVSKKP